MKKLIIFFLFLLLSIGLYSQNSVYNKKIHKDYGTWSVRNDEHIISVCAFVTIEIENDVIHENELEKAKIVAPEIKYHYELYMVSKSIYEGNTTNTWLYGMRIYVSGNDVLINQFPDGFLISIKTEPTLIHTHHSYKTDVEFEITWEKSIYEPRIRK